MARRPENAPRISLNKLCEFMTASIPRQRRIIKDQKFPSDFMRIYYEGVRSTRQRLRDLQDACETIAALWPTITE